MKVRVVIRVSPVRPDAALGAVCNVFRQLPCRVGGHKEELDLGTGKLALKCSRCGWRSAGWSLESRPPMKLVG